ncbi:choice-of-anchor B family protein [Owenweeksia hongkongensis]|uniref:choice-of-anchor B family protein n=1 Tax=Owenweeksia hongkongensis TaxID=253245 RepID=UPI003A90E15A
MKKLFSLWIALLCAFSISAQDSLGVEKLSNFKFFDGINDIWGYADTSGNEYALVGINSGFAIVDVTVPTNPVQKHFISGANTTWRDIKTWSHYAYVVHDGVGASNSDGIMIVDLNTIDSANISYIQFYPSVTIGGTKFDFHDAHNLYVDENGILYLFGSNIGVGGACMFDLVTDPENPTLLGVYDGNYYHDGVARGDTLWGAAIQVGIFEAVNISNKSNPVVMGSHATPNNFTHNIWFSDDNKTVFTTDERKGAYVAAYDVSDMNNITETDRIRTTIFDPNQVIPHNTHVLGDFLVTSYYTSGLQIVDASNPDILVETAYYDTSPLTGDGFNGAWGAYPFLPSRNILVSDRQEGLFVLSTDYPRACFFTAFVKDTATGNPIINASITMVGSTLSGSTNIFGNFRDGQRDTGDYVVVVQKSGYYPDTLLVKMREGKIVNRTVNLIPFGFSIDEGDVFSDGFRMYPNPNKGSVFIELAQVENPHVEVLINDVSGKMVLQRTVNAGSGKLEIAHSLPEGIYTISISNGNLDYASQKLSVVK